MKVVQALALDTYVDKADRCENDITGLQTELNWLTKIIEHRTNAHVHNDSFDQSLFELIDLKSGSYSDLIQKFNFSLAERITLGLAILVNLKPEVFDCFLTANPKTGKLFREYGGIIDKSTFQFKPTLRTAIFLLSGGNNEKFIHYQNILRLNNKLFTEQIVNLYSVGEHQNYLPDSLIQLDSAYVDYLFAGDIPRLDSGSGFPAKLLETTKTFRDLVLKQSAKDQLRPALNYVRVQQELYSDEKVSGKVNKGFVLLLHGPPGTGKTLTASIIGNELNTQVYQIDSSLVVSKYIGETEKNLERVFSRLEGKNCILFFDEADAMFGKRTEVLDSKDRYANQGVSYLLQRMEKFDGLIILATNYEKNFDDAFKRRILSKIHIGRPGEEERVQLWNNALPNGYSYSSPDLVVALSKHFDFTGANIAIVVKMSVEEAFSQKTKIITSELIAPFTEIVGRELAGVGFRPLNFKANHEKF